MNASGQVAVRHDGFRLATYAIAVLALVAAVAAGSVSMLLALVPLAILLGWSHLSSV